MEVKMNSSRPYLMRAIYEWIVDNQCTPYILVDANMENVTVPQQYVKDGQIVLNISPTAVAQLQMLSDYVSFNARFSGVAMDVFIPVAAVMGIYARENGQGMLFDREDMPDPEPPGKGEIQDSSSASESDAKADSGKRPSLRVVK
jgi:stringent starvation protein B